MALTQIMDLTADFNADAKANVDISNWDSGVLQIVTASGAISFNATNNGGGVEGVSNGKASTAANFEPVQLTNLATGSGVTSTATDGLFKFLVIGNYFQIVAAANTTVAKAILFLSKIS